MIVDEPDVVIKKRGRVRKTEERKTRVVKEKFQNEVMPPVTAMNDVQREFLSALKKYPVVVFNAPAGVGKSHLTMSEVTDWLKKGVTDRIVISRPAIPMGRSIGLVPGTTEEKFSLYILPLLDVIWKRYGKNWYDTCVANGTIKLIPPEYARGLSIDCTFVLDECQGFHPDELYTMLTRLEDGGKLIMIGDPNQSDIKGQNGINWLCDFVETHPELQEYVKVIHATSDDIVRSGLCKALVKAKEKERNIANLQS